MDAYGRVHYEFVMDTLQLVNYRRFKDTGVIHLKPITFLVGANSSGKSSFLKFFPLLKQSLGVNRNGTFLWYSTDVDFKDFQNTVHRGEGKIDIEFTFSLQNMRHRHYGRRDNNEMTITLTDDDIQDKVEQRVKLEISAKRKNEKTNEDFLSLLSIKYLDQSIQIHITEDENAEVVINGRKIEAVLHPSLTSNSIRLLPRIYEKSNENLYMNVIQTAVEFFKNNISSDDEKLRISFMELEDAFYLLDKQTSFRYLKGMNLNGDEEFLNDMYILLHLNEIIDDINYYLFDVSSSITYVRPLRVTTERYYRYQNYAVDEIDSDGKNLAMYLANLSNRQMTKFTDWTSTLFGFSIVVLKHEGHVELQIREGGKEPRNLVDTGFGYTQLLPIVTMIWNVLKSPSKHAFYRGRGKSPKYIVIEQPELHLHPRLQAKFGAMLANVIEGDGEGNNLKFIIETHSEAILNAIGVHIEHKELHSDKVNVVLFNADAEGYDNYIEEVKYNERGFIEHWPTGFLSEDVY